jgi:hypothetical protein
MNEHKDDDLNKDLSALITGFVNSGGSERELVKARMDTLAGRCFLINLQIRQMGTELAKIQPFTFVLAARCWWWKFIEGFLRGSQ